MKVISVRKNPEYKEIAIEYISQKWLDTPFIIYKDCITHCIVAQNPLPQWYLLQKDNKIIGCAGLITNDFISRMDLYPWFCALFIDENYRGKQFASLLIEKAKEDTCKMGFDYLYLSTDHIEYYEKFGFEYIGQGYHPWGEESRIYQIVLK